MTFATYAANPAEDVFVPVRVPGWHAVDGEARSARVEFVDGRRVWVPAWALHDIYTDA